MNLLIKEVKTFEEIYNILNSFTPVLCSLYSGMVDKKKQSEKLSSSGVVLTLNLDKQIVAFASFYCNDKIDKKAYLSMIAVHSEVQGFGYGKKLLKEVFIYVTKQGMETLELEVRKNNHSAIQFYKKIGFVCLENETEETYFMSIDLKGV